MATYFRNYLKKVFWSNLCVGSSFQVLDPAYGGTGGPENNKQHALRARKFFEIALN